MKLKYLFLSIVASVLCLVGCQEEALTLDNIKLSQTFLSIPVEGGDAVLKITANEDWKFVQDENWPEVVKFAKDENGKTYKASHDQWGNLTNDASEIASKTPAWLTADVLSGGNGETTVTFHAGATEVGREFELKIVAGERNLQFVKVRQGDMSGAMAWPGKASAITGATYELENVVVSALGNYASYGAFYVTDGFGENVQIYGSTSDSKKNYPNVEVGDKVTFSGVWSSYGNFENAEISKHSKSLLKVITASKEVAKEGETFEIKAEFKGEGAYFTVAPECAAWLSVSGVKTEKGTPSKLDPNPASIATYTVVVAPNEGGDRAGKITLSSGSSSVDFEFIQKGAVIDASVAEFLAATEGETQYRVTGVIKSISVSEKHHNADITVLGGAGEEILLYRVVTKDGNIEDLKLAENDLVTVVGKRSSHNGTPQMAQGGVCEKFEQYKAVTIEEFLAAAEDDTKYAVSGKITKLNKLDDNYNNVEITVTDGTKEVLLFRAKPIDKTKVSAIGLEVGGTVTVAGKRGSHNGAAQMAAGGYILRYSAPTGGGDEPDPTPGVGQYVKVTSSLTDWSGKYVIVFGTEAHATLNGKDLAKTADVTIANGIITSDVDAAVVTVTKNADNYVMTLPDGNYFAMAHNSCTSSAEPFNLSFEYTEAGVKISGYVAAKDANYYLYANSNNGSFYRCYVDKTGMTGYALPELYKYTE